MRGLVACVVGALAVIGCSSAYASAGPQAHFVNALIPLQGIGTPWGLALDGSGNIFVADFQGSSILEIPAAGGYGSVITVNSGFEQSPYAVAVDGNGNLFVAVPDAGAVYKLLAAENYATLYGIGHGFTYPVGLAVDGSGNVFVADQGGSSVKEVLAAGGYATVNTLGSGFASPTGVAVDESGNVFVADNGNSLVKEILASDSTIHTLGSGFAAPYGVAVDGSGNVFVADYSGNSIKKILASSGYTTVMAFGGSFYDPQGVALDRNGNLFVADTDNHRVVELQTQSVNVGTVDVGQSSSRASLFFQFDAAGQIALPAALTQGAAGLDFADAGSGSCTANGIAHAYDLNEICSVDVTFAPKFSGIRSGAVLLQDGSGNTIATGNVYGTGTAPQVGILPATQSNVGSGISMPYAVALDGSGNIYVGDWGNEAVKQILASNGSIATLAAAGSIGVAVDGSGNVFFSDISNGYVKEIVAVNGGIPVSPTILTLGSAVGSPGEIAVDGNDNVFFAELSSGSVKEIPAGCLVAGCIRTIYSGFSELFGLAVDADDNVFVSDQSNANNAVYEIPAAGGYATANKLGGGYSLSHPAGVALDGNGNLFVSDMSHNTIVEFAAGNYTTGTVVGTGLSQPKGLALDAKGNVFVADDSNNRVVKIAIGDSPAGYSFATPTNVGSQDTSDSTPTVTVQNIGNAPLTFAVPNAGMNASIAANFAIDGTSTCPQIGTEGSPIPLAPNASCTYGIDFVPQDAGSISGSLTLTDNALNAAGASQSVGFSGTGVAVEIAPDVTETTVAVSPTVLQSNQTATITATITDSTHPGFPATGPVTFTDTLNSTTTNLNGGNPVNLQASVATLSNVTLSGNGTHTISATYAGMGSFAGSSGSTTVVVGPPAANVGSGAAPFPVTVTFTAAGTVSTINVFTGGAQSLDFGDMGDGDTCSGFYNVGDTCIINVTFAPRYPGPRYGAVVLQDVSGNVLATAYIQGQGTGPQTRFRPGTLSTMGGGFQNPEGVAVDEAGNVYVVDLGLKALTKTPAGCTNGACVTTLPGKFTNPYGVAIDGAGNVYVGDYSTQVVTEVPAGCASSDCVIGLGGESFLHPDGIAVDGNGNVYVADSGNNTVTEMPPGCASESCVTSLGGGFNWPQSVAVDGSGNVYVADTGNNLIKTMPCGCASVACVTNLDGGFSGPFGVAVDGRGNIFVADTGHSSAKEMPAGCISSSCVITLGSGTIYGIAVGADGNIYLANTYEGGVDKLNYMVPPSLAFETPTAAGSDDTSDGPQSIIVDNIGNADLTFAVGGLSHPTDFVQVEGTGTPADCVSEGTVASGASCNISIEFRPLSVESFSESFVLTNNSLNVEGATQAINLSGTGIANGPTGDTTATTVVASPNSLIAGQTASVTVTVTDSTVNDRTPSGTVTFTDTLNSTTTNLNDGEPVTLQSGVASLSGIILSGAGTHTITAIYAGVNGIFLASSGNGTVTVFPNVTIGAVPASFPVTLTLPNGGTVTSVNVLTQGSPNLDFTESDGGDNCSGLHDGGETCTVNVVFSPKYPGERYGAVVLKDKNGAVVATTYLVGSATGPQVNFLPGTQSLQGDDFSSPEGVAIDGAGNIFVADIENGTVTKMPTGCDSNVCVTSLGSFSQPEGVAVDGAGNVYVTDFSTNQVTVMPTDCDSASCVTPLGSGFSHPWGVAVDGSGNIYVADMGHNAVKRISAGCNSSECPVTTLGSGFSSPVGVAVDADGNIYVVDSGHNAVKRMVAGCNSSECGVATVGAGFSSPSGVAVDGIGNIFVADSNNGALKKMPASCASSECVITVGGNFGWPTAVTVDGSGNAYVSDDDFSVVSIMDFADGPSLSFKSGTTVGSVDESDGAQTVTVENVGNAALAFALGAPTDFIQVAGSGIPADCESSGTLAAGAACNLSVAFKPTTTGALTESYGITDNSLDAEGATQSIALSGTGVANVAPADTTATAVAVSPNAVAVGQAVTITATVSDTNNSSTTPNGAVTFTDTVNSTTTDLNNGASITLTSGTASLSGIILSGAGTHTITATYAGVDGTFVGSIGNGMVTVAPSSNVGTATPIPTMLTFTADGTVSSVNVLTQGASNLDFTDALSGDTCSGSRSIGDTCIVNVVFTPKYPGLRYGAVVLKDSSGNVLATAYVQGTGTAPQANFSPAAKNNLGGGFNLPFGVALDGSGNVYVADFANHAVTEMPADCVSSACLTTLGGGFNAPFGVAVDGAGNVYVGDDGNNTLSVMPPGCTSSSCVRTLASGYNHVDGVAVDGSGNVYFASRGDNAVMGMPLGCASSECITNLGGGFNSPFGVAVDASGKVYVADYANSAVKVMAAGCTSSSCTTTVGGGFNGPYGVAVDGMGNVWVADTLNNAWKKMPSNCTSDTCVSNMGAVTGYGLAVDGAGNAYLGDNNGHAVWKVTYAAASSLSFPTATNMGSTDTTDGAQAATIENVGNAALNFGVAAPVDFIQVPGSGAPADCDSDGTLAAGAACNLSIEFKPSTSGELAESFVLTDNALGVEGATQSISVAGTGIHVADATTITTSSLPNSPLQSQLVTVTATVSDTPHPGTSPVGNVTFVDSVGSTNLGTAAVSNNTASVTYTPALGAHTITSSFAPTDSSEFAASNDATGVTFTVGSSSTTTTASSANLTYNNSSQTVTLTATVTSSAGTVNAGTITFTVINGSTPVGSATTSSTVSGGSASALYTLPGGTAAGTYAIHALYNAAGTYASSNDNTHTLTVAQAAATVTLGSLAQTYTGSAISATATTMPTGLTVSFTYNGSSSAPTAAGSYTVVGTISDANFSGTATGTLVIAKAAQIIVFSPLISPAVYVSPITLSATGGGSGNSVVFSIVSGPGSINGNTLTITGTGSVVIAADQTGNANYSAAPQVTQSIVSLASDIILNVAAQSFGSVPTLSTSPAQTVIVTNLTGSAVTIVSIAASGDFTADSNCPTIAAFGSCSVNVTFTPTTTGARTGALTVTDTQSSQSIPLTGSGTAAGIQITPASLNLGSAVVGTTGMGQTISIQNTGSADLVISHIATTGDFATSGNCAAVPAGSNCSLTLTFTPSTTGARSGTLTLTDNVGGSNQIQVINLSGTGTQAGATITPSVQTFPGTVLGSSSFLLNATLTNTGSAPLTGIVASIRGDFTQTNTCPGTLAPAATCTISVTYSPTVAGTESGSLSVTDNLGTQIASLLGTGLVPGASLSTSELIFGGELVNTSSQAQTVVLTNTGSTGVDITSVASTSNFSDTTNCAGSVAAGASCSINVVFTPTGTGPVHGTVTVTDDAGTQVITLQGQGVSPGLAVSPSFAIFGGQVVGTTSQAQTLTVTNTGTAPLTLNPIVLSNNFTGASQCPAVLQPEAACMVSLSFAPTATGALAGSLTISDTSGLVSTLVTASGQGTLPGIDTSPSTLSFGSLPVATTSQAQTVTVTNTGTAPLQIGTVTGTGDFAENDTCASQTIAAGSDCVISVTMTPTTMGTRTGAIQFNNSADGQHQIALSGMGQQAGVNVFPTSLAFGSIAIVPSAQAAQAEGTSLSVTISNTGNVPVQLNGFSTQGDFFESDSCGGSVAVGASCTLTIKFAHTGLGHRTGTLTINDNAGGGTQLVSLQGDGSPVGLFLTPPLLNFGVQPRGATSAAQTATLTNNTGQSITNLAITASGEYGESDDCGTDLSNGATCTLNITVTPATVGAITGTITISGGGIFVSGSTAARIGVRAAATNIGGSTSDVGVVAVSAASNNNVNQTAFQLMFGRTPAPLVAAGGNAGSSITVLEDDNNGNPVGAADTITLTISGPGGSHNKTATASGGVAVFNLTTDTLTAAGSYTYTATVASNSSIKSATAGVTVNAGPASTVAANAGSGQSALIGSPFMSPLQVIVKDSYNNPVGGAVVTFSAPTTGGSANLSSPTATTGSNGMASVTATANGIAGSYIVTATALGLTAASFNLNNAAAAPIVGLNTNGNRTLLQSAVTFTATVTSSLGTPTGTVNFKDGATLLGSSSLSSGTATYTTSSLSAGSHTITAVYGGDTDFSAVTSSTLTQSVIDYAVSAAGSSTQTVASGGTATFAITVTPSAGTTFPATATLAIAGLPVGATASVTTSSWAQLTATSWQLPANTALTNISLNVHVAALTTSARASHIPILWMPALLPGVVFLPFACRRPRTDVRTSRKILPLLLLIASLMTMATLGGCGGGKMGGSGSGPTSKTYNLTVTVTSGTLSHSTLVTVVEE